MESNALVIETPTGTRIAIIKSLRYLPDDVDYYMFYPLGACGIAASCELHGTPKTEKGRVKRFMKEGLLHAATPGGNQ